MFFRGPQPWAKSTSCIRVMPPQMARCSSRDTQGELRGLGRTQKDLAQPFLLFSWMFLPQAPALGARDLLGLLQFCGLLTDGFWPRWGGKCLSTEKLAKAFIFSLSPLSTLSFSSFLPFHPLPGSPAPPPNPCSVNL